MNKKLLAILALLLSSAIVSADTGISGNTIRDNTTPLTKLQQQQANRILGNCTGSTANVTACTAAQAKTTLAITNSDVSGLGTAATQNTGTSGANVPLLNGTNTWSNAQTFSVAPVLTSITGLVVGNGASAVTAYAGSTPCSPGFVRTISSTGTTTCAQVAIATDVSGLGTGIATALGVNVGSAGAPVLFNGAGGTPSSITLTNGTNLPLTGLQNQAANTVVANITGGAAAPTAVSLASFKTWLALVASDISDFAATVRATVLTGLSTSSLNAILSSDSILQALGKLQAQFFNIQIDATAVCGFTTANSAAANQTAMANCISNMPAGGGRIYIGAGTFQHDGTFTVNKPIIFVGAGRAITNICSTSASADQFDLTSGSQGAGFEQLRLTGCAEGTRTSGYAIDMNGIANVYAQQVDILFHHSGIRSCGALQFVDDTNIREGGENAANGQAILIDCFGDRYIRRVTTDGGPGDPTGYAGIRIRQASSVVITDSNIINSTNALDIVPNGGGGTAVASVLVTGTFFDSSTIGVNILPVTSSDTAHRIRFVNSWFGSNTTANFKCGNGTIPNANSAAIEIIGSDFFGGGVTPIGLDVDGCTDWSVRGSRFGGHTTRAIDVAVGTGTADHRFSITDNIIGNVLGGGTNAQGVTIGAGTYGPYQILDNRGFDQNTTAGISDGGSISATGQKNVANNMGCLAGAMQPLASGGGSTIAGRGAATSGTGETFLMTFRVPPNCVSVGDVIHLTATLTSSSTGTFGSRIRLGATGTIAGDTAVSVLATSAAGTANSTVVLNVYVYVVALGPTATVYAMQQGTSTAAAFSSAAGVAEAPGNVPTTAAWFITWTGITGTGTYTVRSVRARII